MPDITLKIKTDFDGGGANAAAASLGAVSGAAKAAAGGAKAMTAALEALDGAAKAAGADLAGLGGAARELLRGGLWGVGAQVAVAGVHKLMEAHRRLREETEAQNRAIAEGNRLIAQLGRAARLDRLNREVRQSAAALEALARSASLALAARAELDADETLTGASGAKRARLAIEVAQRASVREELAADTARRRYAQERERLAGEKVGNSPADALAREEALGRLDEKIEHYADVIEAARVRQQTLERRHALAAEAEAAELAELAEAERQLRIEVNAEIWQRNRDNRRRREEAAAAERLAGLSGRLDRARAAAEHERQVREEAAGTFRDWHGRRQAARDAADAAERDDRRYGRRMEQLLARRDRGARLSRRDQQALDDWIDQRNVRNRRGNPDDPARQIERRCGEIRDELRRLRGDVAAAMTVN